LSSFAFGSVMRSQAMPWSASVVNASASKGWSCPAKCTRKSRDSSLKPIFWSALMRLMPGKLGSTTSFGTSTRPEASTIAPVTLDS
jgi:hypothetical protein